MAQPMRQFIQPDFQAEQQPMLDWMPWDAPPEGNKDLFNNVQSRMNPVSGGKGALAAGTAGKAAAGSAGSAGKALGAASL